MDPPEKQPEVALLDFDVSIQSNRMSFFFFAADWKFAQSSFLAMFEILISVFTFLRKAEALHIKNSFSLTISLVNVQSVVGLQKPSINSQSR